MMNVSPSMIAAWLLASCALATADTKNLPDPAESALARHANRAPSAAELKEFDLDGNGSLSAAERTTMRAALRERAEEMRKQMLARFDRNQDGTLDAEERRAMRQSLERKILLKYDANQDGRLDTDERRSMIEEEALGVYFWNDFDRDVSKTGTDEEITKPAEVTAEPLSE